MNCKTDWNENDFVNVSDFNRIRTNLALLSGDGAYCFPEIVDASYDITEEDVFELRSRYEMAAEAAGILSDGPSNALHYEVFDPSVFEGEVELFPRLRWLTLFKGYRNFPAAWELNLYEKLCKRLAEYSPQQKGLIYVGGITKSSFITISI